LGRNYDGVGASLVKLTNRHREFWIFMQRQVVSLLGGLSIVGLTVAIGVLGGSGRAIAENGCPDGYQPYQTGNMTVPGCMPIPNYGNNNNIPAQPRRELIEVAVPSYGAVAHDPVTGSAAAGGAAEDRHKSKKSAEKAALKACRAKNGGKDGCVIVASVKDACIRVFIGNDKVTHQSNLTATVFPPLVNDAAKDLENGRKVCDERNTDCMSKYFCAHNNITKFVRQ
jgi:Domain of unknown function (DUF4189)